MLSRGLGCWDRLERSPVLSAASQSLPSLISTVVQSRKQAPRHASGFRLNLSPMKVANRSSMYRLGQHPCCWYSRREGRMNIFGGTPHVVEQSVEADKVRVGNGRRRPLRLNAVLDGR